MRLLIGYASRFGSTRDVAIRIADTVADTPAHWRANRSGCSASDRSAIDTPSSAWGRLLFKALGGHAGDNRHWPDIDAWAEEIAQEVRVPSAMADPRRGTGVHVLSMTKH
jgi:hypothetical protein